MYGDTLTYEEGMQIVNDMLLVCQKLKSNLAEILILGNGFTQEDVDKYCDTELTWLSGKNDIVPLLIDISMGLKPLTGSGLMNLMHIAHRSMNGLISVIAPLRLPEDRDLPEPNPMWVTLGTLEKP